MALIFISYYSYYNHGIVYSLFTSDVKAVSDFIGPPNLLSVLVLLLLVILEVVVAVIPPFVLYIVGGFIFGTFLGGTIVLIGNIIGSAIAFYIARRYGRKFIEKGIPKKTREVFDRFSEKYGGVSIFLLRLNPLTSSDAFSYLAGLSSMSMQRFILGTALGLAPLIYIQSYIGADLLREIPFLFSLFVVVSFIYLVLFLYGLWCARRAKKRKK